MREEQIPVLVVGGGLAGLSTAVFLGHHGVASLVVERHSDLLIHPRARGFNPRTVEIYRQAGLEPAILALCNFAGDFGEMMIVRVEIFAAEEFHCIEQSAEGQL